MEIVLQDIALQLLHERAVYIPEYNALLVADVHLGKAAHFRKHGLAVPHDVAVQDMLRLDELMRRYDSDLYILGDLVHSSHNEEWNGFVDTRRTWKKKVVLTAGNHDTYAVRHARELGVDVVEEYHLGPFLLKHKVTRHEGQYVICGHIHPAVVMSDNQHWYERMRCYHIEPQCLTLPAFGRFTGSHVIHPGVEDRIVVVGDNFVQEVLIM